MRVTEESMRRAYERSVVGGMWWLANRPTAEEERGMCGRRRELGEVLPPGTPKRPLTLPPRDIKVSSRI